MKKIKYIIASMALMFMVSSCTDFVDPAIPYSGFETGTYLKTIGAPPALNFFDLDNSKFVTTLEVHAAEKVNNVKQVDVYVAHRRGATVSKEALVTTIPGTAFALGANSAWPRAAVSVAFNESISKIGFTKTNIKGGDFLEYRLVLTTTDGKTFSNNNLTGDVSGGVYYASPFFYRLAIVCPSDLGGELTYEQINIITGPGGTIAKCNGKTTGTVTLAAAATAGQYTMTDATFGLFACLYSDTPPAGTLRFTDSCGKIGMVGADKYGDSYSISGLTVTGTKMTYTWINTYGDGGLVTLTRKDGKNWPAGLN